MLSLLLTFAGFPALPLQDPPPVPPEAAPAARLFPEAETLFHREPRWLGADAAITVPLGGERTLWLFGDTFVATSERLTRRESTMVRNTIALQTGLDPLRAEIGFHWATAPDGRPASYFPERDLTWYWPGGGVRLAAGPLLIFLYTLEAAPGRGLGFQSAGFALAIIDDPSEPVPDWKPRIHVGGEPGFDALPATAVVEQGEHTVALAIRQDGIHAGALVRYPSTALARGDFVGAEWWAGPELGWKRESELPAGGPVFVLDDAGAECSLHFDRSSGRYVHVASYGFGSTTIGLRTAPELTGPWTPPRTIYRPPESGLERPFVYAAKAHPELETPGGLLVTYAVNCFDFSGLLAAEGERALYWPRAVLVSLDP